MERTRSNLQVLRIPVLSHVPDTVTHIKASLSQINQTIKSSPNAKLMPGVHGGHDLLYVAIVKHQTFHAAQFPNANNKATL